MQRLLAGRLARFLAACALIAGSAWAAQAPAQAVPAGVGPTYEVVMRDLPQTIAAEGVVEAVRQATLGAQVAGRDRRAGRQGGRHRARRARCWRGSTPAPPSRRWRPAGRRSPRPRRTSPTPGGKHDRNVNLFAQKFVSQAAVDQSEAELKAAQAQLDCAQGQRGAGERRTDVHDDHRAITPASSAQRTSSSATWPSRDGSW